MNFDEGLLETLADDWAKDVLDVFNVFDGILNLLGDQGLQSAGEAPRIEGVNGF